MSKLVSLFERNLLCKGVIIQFMNNTLKDIRQIEYTIHRSHFNSIVDVLYGLIPYLFQPEKPYIAKI